MGTEESRRPDTQDARSSRPDLRRCGYVEIGLEKAASEESIPSQPPDPDAATSSPHILLDCEKGARRGIAAPLLICPMSAAVGHSC